MDIVGATAAELATQLAAKKVSAAEVTAACLDRIAAVDDRVRAFLYVDRADAMAQA